MDKVKVNNQVVKMRKHVKRARLFAINKFTKQIKHLQSKKGNDSQADKKQRKVERLLEKVQILKKMLPDFVSKKALSKAQDWSATLTQKNITLEDQCLALLANDNEVQKEVEKFYAEECQLADKIPSLLLEWEMKSKMPKSPDQKKKAFDIKRQKMCKIAKRKNNNFQGATFPNNVAVNKKIKLLGTKRTRLPNSVSNENDSNGSDQLKSESFSDAENSKSKMFITKSTKNTENSVHSEPMGDNLNRNDELDLELRSGSSDDESQEIFTKACKNKESFLSPKQEGNKLAEELNNEAYINNSFALKLNANENSETCTQPSIYERLSALANTDIKKSNKSNLATQNTKAIKFLDLNELQNAEQIPILQNISVDFQEPETPQTLVPKKDSFFLNGDEEVVSSEDESNVNRFKGSKHKFSNFRESENKFKVKCFSNTPHTSFKNFNQSEKKFQNRKVQSFNQKGNRFPKSVSQLNVQKKLDIKGHLHKFKHSDSSKINDSSHFQRKNKKNALNNSFQPNEKVEEKKVQLHPSWEAKNKLKEAAKSGFKGKRIVFD